MSAHLDADRFLDTLLDRANRRLAPPGVIFTADTPLFASRLVDSIRVLDLIAWTEQLTGARVPDAMIRLDNFASARRIAELFGGLARGRRPHA